jgi:hypothetical protein
VNTRERRPSDRPSFAAGWREMAKEFGYAAVSPEVAARSELLDEVCAAGNVDHCHSIPFLLRSFCPGLSAGPPHDQWGIP